MNTQMQSSVFQDEIGTYPTPDSSITTIAVPQYRVRVSTHNSTLMRELEDRFNDVVSLPVGWDGYVGLPVSFTTAKFAALIIERLFSKSTPVPSIVPGADGSMQIEWHVNGYDIELDVLGPLKVEAYRFDHVSGDVNELELESDFTQIADWIYDLSIERNFQAQPIY